MQACGAGCIASGGPGQAHSAALPEVRIGGRLPDATLVGAAYWYAVLPGSAR